MLYRFLIAGALLVIVPGLASAKDELCTFGEDCYCDCADGNDRGDGYANESCKQRDVPVDPQMIICEDFENPKYETDAGGPGSTSAWRSKWGPGTSACKGNAEGPNNPCLNILHDPGTNMYQSGNADLSCSGDDGFSDCVFQGHQSLGEPCLAGGNNKCGGEPGRIKFKNVGNSPTDKIAVTYADSSGGTAAGFPENPNGSVQGIAGITNPAGNVLGLMPHPERFLRFEHDPTWTRRAAAGEAPADPGRAGDGYRFFELGVGSGGVARV